MNTYRKSPVNQLDTKDLTIICDERFELYKIIEEAKLENFEIGTKEWSDYIKLRIKEDELKTYSDLLSEVKSSTFKKSQRIDNTAHWLIGLGYSNVEEHHSIFVTWELQWFHLIFMNSSEQDRDKFLEINELNCKEVEAVDVLQHYDKLDACLGCDCLKNAPPFPKLYKTHWTEILEIVGVKKAYLYMGTAYFLPEDIVYCVKNKLKDEFFKSLRFQKRNFPSLSDPRPVDFIKTLPLIRPRKHFNGVDGVNLSNLDELTETHYPLCMRHLHRELRKQHHLKYLGKMQYGIFLYYLGLPYEDAMEFWRTEFTKKMDEKLYNSKYQYLFKHQYGQVGRRHEYPSLTCEYILNYHPPMYQQNHGCPYKHWSSEKLKETLQLDCHVQDIRDIEDLVADGKYQKACTMYMCKTKNIYEGAIETIDSPIEYVQTSLKESSDCLDYLFSLSKL